jgi:hypothetical protein
LKAGGGGGGDEGTWLLHGRLSWGKDEKRVFWQRRMGGQKIRFQKREGREQGWGHQWVP